MNGESYLIVEQRPGLDAPVEAFLAGLGPADTVDAFSARQRLIGRGLSLLARGRAAELDRLLQRLHAHGIEGWRIEPGPVLFAPRKLQSITAKDDVLHFELGNARLSLQRGARVLAVLADLSGSVADKSLKRLMARKIYQGSNAVAPLEEQELRQAILRAEPVLDLYLFDAAGEPSGAVRVLPGRFDHRGLGERAGLSASGNLDALLDLVGEYASPLILRTEFGMANLPGCRPPGEETQVGAERLALEALTRFGSLALQLVQAGLCSAASADELPPLASVALAGVSPEAAAAAMAVEHLVELDVRDRSEPSRPLSGPQEKVLPPPPEIREEGGGLGRKILAGGGGLALLAASMLLAEDRMLALLWQYGVRTGLVPGMLSAGLFLAAFYYLILKRRIENTPTSKVRSLAMGLVELHGRAERLYGLVSPISQLPCVYYRIRRYRRSNQGQWQLSSEDTSGPLPFCLEDGTGRVRIDPRGATLRIRSREGGWGGEGNILLGFSGAVNTDEKWVEEVIPEGSCIYLMGFADVYRPQGSDRRQRLAGKLRTLKGDAAAMRSFDTDGDGVISPQEWDRARRRLEDEVLVESLEEAGSRKKQQEQILIRHPGSRRLPFIIAETESETRMTGALGLLVPVFFLGAVLAGGVDGVYAFRGVLKRRKS